MRRLPNARCRSIADGGKRLADEAAIIADYDAQSAVERELVLRLASALWRLRRATAMETGLFEIEADHLSAAGTLSRLPPPSRDVVYALFRHDKSDGAHSDDVAAKGLPQAMTPAVSPRLQSPDEEPAADPSRQFAQCFLSLADQPTSPLDRLSRYEYALWRQVAQILFALDNLNRRKPQERRSSLVRGHPTHRPDEADHHYHDDR